MSDFQAKPRRQRGIHFLRGLRRLRTVTLVHLSAVQDAMAECER